MFSSTHLSYEIAATVFVHLIYIYCVKKIKYLVDYVILPYFLLSAFLVYEKKSCLYKIIIY